MSDPARDGFQCCETPMESVLLQSIDPDHPTAFACYACFKWRHALPVGDARRPAVVGLMNDWADREYRKVSDGR